MNRLEWLDTVLTEAAEQIAAVIPKGEGFANLVDSVLLTVAAKGAAQAPDPEVAEARERLLACLQRHSATKYSRSDYFGVPAMCLGEDGEKDLQTILNQEMNL